MPFGNTAVPKASRRKNNLYYLAVIILSVATIGLLAGAVVRIVSHRAVGKAADDAVTALERGFSCTADVTVNGTAYEVKLSKPAQGGCTMTFVKPAALNQLSFVQSDSGLKVKYGVIEVNVDPSTIPQTSVFSAVTDVFDAAAAKGAAVKTTKAGATVTGDTSAGKFTLALDKAMAPQSLTMPSLKLSAAFHDFKIVS